MITLQLDSFVLDSTNGITVTGFRADSSVPLTTDSRKVARRHGAVRVGATYDPKIITISGWIKGTDWNDLQNKLNAMKEAMVGVDINLDYDNGTSNIRWIVDIDGEVEVPRERTEINMVRFTVEYKAINPPFSFEAVRGGAKTVNTVIDQNLSQDEFSQTIDFGGSAPPEVKAEFTITDPSQLTGIELSDVNGARSILVEPVGMVAGDKIVIDAETPQVTKNNERIDYTGQFPFFQAESSPITVNLYTSTGLILDQFQKSANNELLLIGTTKRYAQSFMRGTPGPLSRLSLALRKFGTGQDVSIRIETNNAGVPSGTAVTNGTKTVTAAQIGSQVNWVNVSFSPSPDLTAATLYWIVVTPTSGDLDNYVAIQSVYPSKYANGSLSQSLNSGTHYTAVTNQDLTFKLYCSAGGQSNQTIDQDSFFDTFGPPSTYRDAGNTTALVDNSGGVITMNGVLQNLLDSFTGTGYDWQDDACQFCDAPFFKFTVPGPAGGTVKLKDLRFWAKRGTNGNANISIMLRSTYNGSNLATTIYTATSDSYVQVDLTGLNWNVTAGQEYWIGFHYYTWEGAVQGVQGTGSSAGTLSASTNVVNLTDWNRDDPSFSGTWQYSGTAGIRHQITFEYTGYTTSERYQTNALDTTDADILSVSQLIQTILLSGAVATTQISADGGTTWDNITRDNTLWDTETVPTVIGSGLKFRSDLTSTTLNKPFLNELTLGYRKGIALDSTTKKAAMSFTPTTTGSVARLDLFLRKFGTPGDITVRVETDSAGSPSGTLVHATNSTKTLTAAYGATSFGWLGFNYPASFAVTAGTVYWIVVSVSTTASNTHKWLLHANNDRYSAGTMKRWNGSTWSTFASAEDLMFRTFEGAGGSLSVNYKLKYTKRYL